MTTVRLSKRQKRNLERAMRVVEAYRGLRLSRGAAIDRLATFALERPAEWAAGDEAAEPRWKDDPLLDPDIGWDMGPTDEKSVKRLVYGWK